MKLHHALLSSSLLLFLGGCSGDDEAHGADAGDHGAPEVGAPAEDAGAEVATGYGALEGFAFRNPSTFGTWVFGGQPSEADLAALKERGVTRVVDLRTEAEDRGFDEPAACEALGLEYVAVPFSPGDYDDATIDALLARMGEGGDTFVHCASGNRVQLAFALHRVLADGVDLETAIEEGKAHGMSDSSAELVRTLAAERTP